VKLPPVNLRPLFFRSLRDTFAAPELERLLALRDVDMAAMDQVEALKVRVLRGVAVIDDRIRAVQGAARRLRVCLATALFAGSGGLLVCALRVEPLLLTVTLCAALAILDAFCLERMIRVEIDLRTLKSLENRYLEAVETAPAMAELTDLSKEIYAEARRIAG